MPLGRAKRKGAGRNVKMRNKKKDKAIVNKMICAPFQSTKISRNFRDLKSSQMMRIGS